MIKLGIQVGAALLGFASLASFDAYGAATNNDLMKAACEYNDGKEVTQVKSYKSPTEKGITFYTYRVAGCGGSFNSSAAYVAASKNGKVLDAEFIEGTASVPLGIDPKGGGYVTKSFFYPANDECFGGMFQVVGDTPGYGGKYYEGNIASYYLENGKIVSYVGGC